MNKLLPFVTFAIGAVAGSVVTWQILDKKYEKKSDELVQKETQSIKKSLTKLYSSRANKVEEENVKAEKEAMDDIIAQCNYSSIKQYKPDNKVEKTEEIYVVKPEVFGEKEGYKIVSLTYFEGSNTLVDEDGNIFDTDNIGGKVTLTWMGEWEDDCIHVRNEKLETDYEILSDERSYREVYPHKI